MRNILLVGGMGTGKSTLAERINEYDNSIFHLEGSKYAVRIPMNLGLDPSEISKESFIETILENEHISFEKNLTRNMTDLYGLELIRIYGESFIGELYNNIISRKGNSGVIDSCPKVSNVKYLKDKGFYVVGLITNFETQIKRCVKRKKDLDPITEDEMRHQIINTSNFYELKESMELVDIAFNMNNFDIKNNLSDINYVVSEILRKIS